MWEIQNLYAKLNKLPEPVRSYATSLKAAEINMEMFNVSGVESNKQAALTILIAGIIVKEIEIIGLEQKIAEFLGWDKEKSLNLAIEIVGSRLLICDDWLEGKAEKYLRDNSVDPSRYASIMAEHQLAISQEAEYFKEESQEKEYEPSFQDVLDDSQEIEINEEDFKNKEPEIKYDVEAEKKNILKKLKSGLLSILNAETNTNLNDFNYHFMMIWTQDEAFSKEAPQTLLANKEKISSEQLLIDDEEQVASISNLLKGFIRKYGLSANDLNIAEFLSSRAVSRFSDKEKVLALRLLKFHNNINNLDDYLAADLENVPGGFEVLPPKAPTKKQEDLNAGKKTTSLPNKEKKSKKEEVVVETDNNTNLGLSQKTAEEILEPKTSNLARELEVMLQDYSPDTLEYKTISQEIKRLKSAQK